MNSFGRIFRISMFGESHGAGGVGVLLDGCPPGIPLAENDFTADLQRRKSGAPGTTPRQEADRPELKSGIFNGKSTGAPILITFENRSTRSKDYDNLKHTPRPGHADFTAREKYRGFNDYRGGGHFSGRLTLGLVAAGVVAKKIIRNMIGPVSIKAELIEAGGQKDIRGAVEKALEEKNSIGGMIECTVVGLPVGLGEPFFDSVESMLSHMMFSIPAIKGIEFGAGFGAAKMTGSEHNDRIMDREGHTATNHSGGINGGISNGNPLRFRVAVKPTPSIPQPQDTFNFRTGCREELVVEGRHDACIALRAPVVIENATAIVLADFAMVNQ